MKHLKSHPESKVDTFDPVYNFFIEASNKKRKRVYNAVLQKVQVEQKIVSRKAEETFCSQLY